VYAPSEDKVHDINSRFYEELEQVFNQCPIYQKKILLEDFYAKVGSEDIFKPIVGNKNLHEANNNNGVVVVNYAVLKNIIVRKNHISTPRHS
jgi:hypothetical protein